MKYSFVQEDYNPGDPIEFYFCSPEEDDEEYIADLAAEHFYNNCDGWEYEWPIKFEMFYDGKSIGTFEVEMSMEPTFGSRKVTK